jgi:hypothetical protein
MQLLMWRTDGPAVNDAFVRGTCGCAALVASAVGVDQCDVRLLLAATILLIGCAAVQLRIVVFDPAITVRNTVTRGSSRNCLANLQESSAADSTDVRWRLSFFHRLAALQAARAAALAHPHFQRPRGRAVRR